MAGDNNPAKSEAKEATATLPTDPPVVSTNNVSEVTVDDAAVESVLQAVVAAAASSSSPKKKRLCRYPGCTKVIKSQGHCQRHGAKAKRCKVVGCDKQAQGTHDGMCKRHWKQVHFPPPPPKPEEVPPPPEGESVYDVIIPSSITYRPPSNIATGASSPKIVAPLKSPVRKSDSAPADVTADAAADAAADVAAAAVAVATASVSDNGIKVEPDPPPPPEGASVMPLISFLREAAIAKDAGWHRNSERRARGMFPVSSLSSQLEPWERQLALVEILLLSGGTPYANFKDLAYAWGREKGFHQLLCQSVCERRGEVERKKRSDAGRTMSSTEREAFRVKLKRARLGREDGDDDGDDDDDDDSLGAQDHVAAMTEEIVNELESAAPEDPPPVSTESVPV